MKTRFPSGIISALASRRDALRRAGLSQLDPDRRVHQPREFGGPLINIDGELIGINVAVRAGAQGIGFALPIDEVKRVAAEMLSTRRLASSWHGLVSSEQRRGLEARRRGQRGAAGEPGGSRRASSPATNWSRSATWRSPVPSTSNAACSTSGRATRRPSRSAAARPSGRFRSTSRRSPARSSTPDDLVWRLLGLKTQQVSNDYVSAVSPKLRGGLYIQDVSPGSPAAQAAIQKGDILVGMNVGTRHWETIRPDNILYVLRQPETTQTRSAILYLVRRNGIQPSESASWIHRQPMISLTTAHRRLHQNAANDCRASIPAPPTGSSANQRTRAIRGSR